MKIILIVKTLKLQLKNNYNIVKWYNNNNNNYINNNNKITIKVIKNNNV